VAKLSSENYTEDEWRIIISIINKNKLLKYFILHHETNAVYKPTEREISSLYRLLNYILKQYLEWTKKRISVDYFNTTQI
jgi:hypothetical protein